MSSYPVWGALSRALNDPTVIDQAIDAAIAAHNDEPEAHLAAEQSLETHRANDVIDHPAESVVNDKVAVPARAYVAIVDPTDEYSYDTVQAAIAFAASVGGGTILIKAGLHYLSGEIEMINSINLTGQDADNTQIIGGVTAGNYIRVIDDTAAENKMVRFEGIGFQSTGGAVIVTSSGDMSQESTLLFNDCSFTGGGRYLSIYDGRFRLDNCFVEANTEAAFEYRRYFTCWNTILQKTAAGSACRFFRSITGAGEGGSSKIYYTTLDLTGATSGSIFDNSGVPEVSYYFCTMVNFRTYPLYVGVADLIGCRVEIGNAQVFYIYESSEYTRAFLNDFNLTGTGRIDQEGETTMFIANRYTGSYSGFNGLTPIEAQGELLPLINNGTGSVALDFRRRKYVQITANANKTLTTTTAPAGHMRVVEIITNSTTSRTISFGSGFTGVANLATGTVNVRRFLLTFISDGSSFKEISRTGAMT